MALISPSILSADFSNLGADCKKVLDMGADMLHFDVMDGQFVPNISVGIPVLQSLAKNVDAVYDVHLMIKDPLKYVSDFAKAGADYITFHVEADSDVRATIAKIKECNVKSGLVIKPNTPVSDIEPYLADIDMALVMTVEPGFGGQTFMFDMMDKVRELAKIKKERNLDFLIEIDGGVNSETSKVCREAGADVLVAGSAVFLSSEPKKVIDDIKG